MTNSNLTTALLWKKFHSAFLSSDTADFFSHQLFITQNFLFLKQNHRCLTSLLQLLPSHTLLTTYLNPHLLYLDHSQGVKWQLPYVTDTLPPGCTLKQQHHPSNHTRLSPHYKSAFLKMHDIYCCIIVGQFDIHRIYKRFNVYLRKEKKNVS